MKRFLPDTKTDKIPYVLLGFEKKCTQLWEDSVNLWQIYRKLGQLLQLQIPGKTRHGARNTEES